MNTIDPKNSSVLRKISHEQNRNLYTPVGCCCERPLTTATHPIIRCPLNTKKYN